MLTFWVVAPSVLFLLLVLGVVAWVVVQERASYRAWVRTDWVAREMARAIQLPRRVF